MRGLFYPLSQLPHPPQGESLGNRNISPSIILAVVVLAKDTRIQIAKDPSVQQKVCFRGINQIMKWNLFLIPRRRCWGCYCLLSHPHHHPHTIGMYVRKNMEGWVVVILHSIQYNRNSAMGCWQRTPNNLLDHVSAVSRDLMYFGGCGPEEKKAPHLSVCLRMGYLSCPPFSARGNINNLNFIV